MLVTEGKASKRGRWPPLVIALALLLAALLAFRWFPSLAPPVLWVGVVLAAGLVLRHMGLSLLSRFIKNGTTPESTGRPSFTFLIPCLNELPSLRHTVPEMANLRYEGGLVLCYVCEGASADGSLEYLRERARSDSRIVVLEKTTPPGGRGATISYGLAHAPPCNVVGFLDADHVLDQDSFNELVRVFGSAQPPEAVQGVCAASNGSANVLTRLLAIERQWLEPIELQVNPKLGGMTHFGGGQGFFKRALFDDTRLAVDDSMILDDTDLSCRFPLSGHRVAFNPRVATRSRLPETPGEFLDQRTRWGRGWVQISAKHFAVPFRARRLPVALRLDLLRMVLMPVAGVWLYLTFAAALAALFIGQNPSWLALAGLAWPFTLGPGPYLAGVAPLHPRDVLLVLVGIPLLWYVYSWLMVASVVDACILLRKARYAKTAKPA